jgi:hypothetical protein
MTHRIAVVVLALTFLAFNVEAAQATVDSEQTEAMTSALGQSLSEIVPTVFQSPRATSLDGYGIVVTAEVGLAPPRNPFSSAVSPEEVRRSSLERIEALKVSTVELLQSHGAGLESVAANQHVTIIVYMVNPNPVDLPNLASQLVISVRKQDALDLGSATISSSTFAERVSIRED